MTVLFFFYFIIFISPYLLKYSNRFRICLGVTVTQTAVFFQDNPPCFLKYLVVVWGFVCLYEPSSCVIGSFHTPSRGTQGELVEGERPDKNLRFQFLPSISHYAFLSLFRYFYRSLFLCCPLSFGCFCTHVLI